MFEGFRQFGALAGLMGQLPKIKEEFDKLQERLARLSAEGEAGGGLVKVRVNGQFTVTGCSIAPEALGDRELLEDLVAAATNQAFEKVGPLAAEERQGTAASLGIPPGLGLPGLS